MSRGKVLPEVALPAGTRVIADLHLDPRQPDKWADFQTWLAALEAPVLIVLGDLFESWSGGGQARDPAHAALLAELRRRACSGTALYFLHGNRDFLLDASFERAVEGTVYPAGFVGRTAGGRRVLFLHGDELATNDQSYQRFRRVVRSRVVRALAGAAPAALAVAVARALRRGARRALDGKSPAYVELQSSAAAEWCARFDASWLVCGHAHRFRDQQLAGGARWIVLDAFGGARDLLRLTAAGEFAPEASRPRRSLPTERALSSGARMILALDGPAGVGKSTVARRLARALGGFFLDTGAMYRATTLAILERGVAPTDAAGCARVAAELLLDFDQDGHVLVDGRPGEPAVRGAAVTAAVSAVAAHHGVRQAVVARQRALAAAHRIVVAEGRDTTTVVFPDATHKFYLSASLAERALRRAREEHALARLDEIRADIERRDALDSTREHSPLYAAPDAQRVETDGLDVDQVVARLLARVRREPA